MRRRTGIKDGLAARSKQLSTEPALVSVRLGSIESEGNQLLGTHVFMPLGPELP